MHEQPVGHGGWREVLRCNRNTVNIERGEALPSVHDARDVSPARGSERRGQVDVETTLQRDGQVQHAVAAQEQSVAGEEAIERLHMSEQ